MKIAYDSVTSEYLYPLSKEDVFQIKKVVSVTDINKIGTIKFGCNTKTTQQGRIVQRGTCYDIRINFCLNNFTTLLLSDEKFYIAELRDFGALVDLASRIVRWTLPDAKRYATFLLLHEIGHLIFLEYHSTNQVGKFKGSKAEEQWCDRYARERLQKLFGTGNGRGV